MFVKIFKHAFMRPFKTVIFMACISMVAAILSGIFQNVCDGFSEKLYLLQDIESPEWSKYSTLESIFGTLAGFLTLATSILITFEIVVVYSSFNKAIATDEAYLTYTLPASNGVQTSARYLSILVWHVLIFIGAIIAYIFMSMADGLFEVVEMIIDSIFVEFDAETLFGLTELGILGLVIFVSGVAHGFFGVVMTNVLSHKLKRKISSFLVWMLFLFEIVVLFMILVIVSTSPLVYTDAYVHVLIWIYIVIIGCLGALFYYLSYIFMGRRLNVA